MTDEADPKLAEVSQLIDSCLPQGQHYIVMIVRPSKKRDLWDIVSSTSIKNDGFISAILERQLMRYEAGVEMKEYKMPKRN